MMSEYEYTKEDMAAELSGEFDIGLDVARQIAGWITDNYVNEHAALKRENERMANKIADINIECLDKTATRGSILVVLLADTQESE